MVHYAGGADAGPDEGRRTAALRPVSCFLPLGHADTVRRLQHAVGRDLPAPSRRFAQDRSAANRASAAIKCRQESQRRQILHRTPHRRDNSSGEEQRLATQARGWSGRGSPAQAPPATQKYWGGWANGPPPHTAIGKADSEDRQGPNPRGRQHLMRRQLVTKAGEDFPRYRPSGLRLSPRLSKTPQAVIGLLGRGHGRRALGRCFRRPPLPAARAGSSSATRMAAVHPTSTRSARQQRLGHVQCVTITVVRPRRSCNSRTLVPSASRGQRVERRRRVRSMISSSGSPASASRHADPLALPAGEFIGHPAGKSGVEFDQFEQFGDAFIRQLLAG